jgi:hypothetical protein
MAAQHRGKAAASPRISHVRKRGRPPIVPTSSQRRRVTLAVAIGLTAEQISAIIDMPRRSLYRAFADELATGRAQRLLASAERLEKMAAAGNVSAARFLHGLMDRATGKLEAVESDGEWDEMVAKMQDDAFLAQNQEFGKPH